MKERSFFYLKLQKNLEEQEEFSKNQLKSFDRSQKENSFHDYLTNFVISQSDVLK